MSPFSYLKKLTDQVFCMKSNTGRDMIFVGFDSLVGFFQSLSFKRRFANQKGEQNATDWPDIHFITVAFLCQDLWCNIIRSTAQRSFAFTVKVLFGSQSKIAQFDLKEIIHDWRKKNECWNKPPCHRWGKYCLVSSHDGWFFDCAGIALPAEFGSWNIWSRVR